MASGADLDSVVRLTSRRVWGLVAAVMVVLGGAAVWATTVHIESTVELDGVLLSGPGPDLVRAPAYGQITQVYVQAGDPVARGATVVAMDLAGQQELVTSATGGVVSSLTVAVGQVVAAGAPLVAVDHVGAPLHAVLLANAAAVVPVGSIVRGAGLTGHVVSAGAYPVPPAQVAARYALGALPGPGAVLVRPLLVDLSVPAWLGATGTPVRLGLVLADQRPIDVVLHGGAR
jgi:Biotin-requiring enzyme